MSNTGDLKALTREYFQHAWVLGTPGTLERFVHPSVIVHGLAEPMQGLPAFTAWYTAFRNAFSAIQCTVTHCMREDDLTTARILFTGTHTGDSLGPPASHKPVSFTVLCLCRWEDNRIVEGFNEFNQLSLMQQIGAIPQ